MRTFSDATGFTVMKFPHTKEITVWFLVQEMSLGHLRSNPRAKKVIFPSALTLNPSFILHRSMGHTPLTSQCQTIVSYVISCTSLHALPTVFIDFYILSFVCVIYHQTWISQPFASKCVCAMIVLAI